MNSDDSQALSMLGWREWVALPELGLSLIKAKVDTGARTSALHAFFVEPYTVDGKERVRFGVHPQQQTNSEVVICSAEVLDQRVVTDSGGHRQKRWVIETPIIVGEAMHQIELTLTARDNMRFRMLLGRTAMENNYLVNPALSYNQGHPSGFDDALVIKH